MMHGASDTVPPLEGMMANLSSVLAQAAADHGERPAVRLDDLVLSYSQIPVVNSRSCGEAEFEACQVAGSLPV
jgi:hypothetical protein